MELSMMNVDKLVAQAKELISADKLTEAKEFITEHKDELGDQLGDVTKLLGDNAGSVVDKVKGLFK